MVELMDHYPEYSFFRLYKSKSDFKKVFPFYFHQKVKKPKPFSVLFHLYT